MLRNNDEDVLIMEDGEWRIKVIIVITTCSLVHDYNSKFASVLPKLYALVSYFLLWIKTIWIFTVFRCEFEIRWIHSEDWKALFYKEGISMQKN